MKESIRFERYLYRTSFHSPLHQGELETQQIEIRKDPLSGRQSIFNPSLEDKASVVYGSKDTALIERLAHESEQRCILCGDAWEHVTPRYTDDLLERGRLLMGQTVLFPNLFPVAQVHAVIRVGSRHYRPLNEFDEAVLQEAFGCAMTFVRRVFEHSPEITFFTVGANYLGPSGASMVHPHFQVIGGQMPTSYLDYIARLSADYFATHDSCYWSDLIEAERERKERYIARTGPIDWVASYAPQGTNEVLGVFSDRRSFVEFGDEEVRGLARGLSSVLKGYDRLGMSTFNFAVYSARMGSKEDSFRCLVRTVTRQNVYENYRTDDSFIQKLLEDEIILVRPETVAATLREVFGAYSEH